jgi:dipeptidyl aminopeptidase/acylaminoacyl peptidase
MTESPWKQRFRWSLPHNPWSTTPQRTHNWHFIDQQGDACGSWFIEPLTGGASQPAAPDLPPAYSTGIAIASNFAIIGSATPDGFTVHRVELGKPSQLFIHQQERIDVGTLSSDEQLICLTAAQQNDWLHPQLHVYNMHGHLIASLTDGPGYGVRSGTWSPLPADRRLIIYRESSGYWHPTLWEPETGTITELPFNLPGDVNATWYPDASQLLLVREWHGRDELYRYDLSTYQISQIDTEAGSIWATGVRADGTVWYRWNNATRPSEIRTEHGERLPSPNNDIPHGTPYKDIVVDGIHVFLAEPSHPGPHPTIFLVYGHPEYHYRDFFFPKIQAWVDHGFAVIIVNCRGSNGYGKAWRDASLGNVGWTEMEDIAKVHDWLISSGIADPDRIVLNGQSWGGYLTLLGLGVQPERWSLGIAELPVGDFITCYEEASATIKATMRVQLGGTAEEVPEAYRKASPLTYIEQVSVPVMLIVGEHDHLCPIGQNERYIAGLQKLKKPHEVYRYAGGHWTYDGEDHLRSTEAQIRFVARHLGTSSPL